MAAGSDAKPIDFSLLYFAADAAEGADGKYRLLLEGAKHADEHGFSAVWTPERHFYPIGGLYPNAALTGAAVAASLGASESGPGAWCSRCTIRSVSQKNGRSLTTCPTVGWG